MSLLLQHIPVVDRHRRVIATRLQLTQAKALATLDVNGSEMRPLWLSLADLQDSSDIEQWPQWPHTQLEIPAHWLDEAHRPLLRELQRQHRHLCLNSSTSMPLPPGFRQLLCAQAAEGALATALETTDDFTEALAQGIAGASGWFFLQSDTGMAPVVGPTHAQIIRVLNLVRNDAEIDEVEAALKADVALAFKLLRYINSAGFGLTREIGSFRHAVTLLGYAKLNRWLSLLLVSASHTPFAHVLMQAAVVRGRYMEKLGETLGRRDGDTLFITGAFSLLDILLGTHIDTLLDKLALPADLSQALLSDTGPLAPFLRLARLLEQGTPTALNAALEAQGLTPEDSNTALLEALAFADRLAFE